MPDYTSLLYFPWPVDHLKKYHQYLWNQQQTGISTATSPENAYEDHFYVLPVTHMFFDLHGPDPGRVRAAAGYRRRSLAGCEHHCQGHGHRHKHRNGWQLFAGSTHWGNTRFFFYRHEDARSGGDG